MPPGVEGRFELFNLRDDLGETTNLASAQPDRVKELDALIDGFLADTGAAYPRPNPAYKPNVRSTAAADPLEGWKARQCEAAVKDGVLTMTGKGKPGAAFLGHGMGKLTGPVVVKFRVRNSSGGAGKIEWLPGGAGDASGKQAVAFNVSADDWQELSVDIPAEGRLGILRLYLPAQPKPAELDWVEVRSKAGKPQRWEFEANDSR